MKPLAPHEIRNYVRLEVGAHTIPSRFEAGHSDEKKGWVSAVHFVRFPVPPDACREFERLEVALVVTHPNEHGRTILSPETKRSLVQDLA